MRKPEILQLPRDRQTRILPLALAAPVFMLLGTVLAVTFIVILAARWQNALVNEWTIIVPAAIDRDQGQRVSDLIQALEKIDAVSRTEWLGADRRDALIDPWFTPDELSDLPVPEIIGLTIDDIRRQDASVPAAIRQAIAATAPDAILDDNGQYLAQLNQIRAQILMAGMGISGLAFTSVLVCVIIMTRLSAARHQDILDILQLIGADDRALQRLMRRRAEQALLKATLWAGLASLSTIAILIAGGTIFNGTDWADLGPSWLILGGGAILILLALLFGATRFAAGRTVTSLLRDRPYL